MKHLVLFTNTAFYSIWITAITWKALYLNVKKYCDLKGGVLMKGGKSRHQAILTEVCLAKVLSSRLSEMFSFHWIQVVLHGRA